MVRRVAMVFGIVFLLVGILGLVSPGGMSMGVASPGMILGLFPVNLLHNIVHLLFGVAGLALGRTIEGARTFLAGGGLIYLVLFVYGAILGTVYGVYSSGPDDTSIGAAPL